MSNSNFNSILSQVKQKIESLNLKDKWLQVKQKIESLNLKDKWESFKLKLDQLPIPKWMLVIVTSVSVIVAIGTSVSKSPNNSVSNSSYNSVSNSSNNFDSRQNEQVDPEDKYDVMVDEFALKVDRLEDLILDMSDSDNPFVYVKQIETLGAECEKLHKKLKAAPLTSRQKLYVDEIYADLEDLIRRLTWN